MLRTFAYFMVLIFTYKLISLFSSSHGGIYDTNIFSVFLLFVLLFIPHILFSIFKYASFVNNAFVNKAGNAAGQT